MCTIRTMQQRRVLSTKIFLVVFFFFFSFRHFHGRRQRKEICGIGRAGRRKLLCFKLTTNDVWNLRMIELDMIYSSLAYERTCKVHELKKSSGLHWNFILPPPDDMEQFVVFCLWCTTKGVAGC